MIDAEGGRLSRRDKHFYAALLREVLSGPDARRVRAELGERSVQMYDALLDRYRSAVRERGVDAWEPDVIDWAAMRAIVPVLLRISDPSEFQTVVGRSPQELAELGRIAETMRREFRTPAHSVSYRIGTCLVTFPYTFVAVARPVIAVPDVASWDLVVPECAVGRREEFLGALRTETMEQHTAWAFEELRIHALTELDEWIADRRARFLAERGRATLERAAPVDERSADSVGGETSG